MLRILKVIVLLALFAVLPVLAVREAFSGDVLVLAALMLLLTWFSLPTKKGGSLLHNADRKPAAAGAEVPALVHGEPELREVEDAFFGHVSPTQGATELYVSLRFACALAADAPQDFFAHLNRLLRDLPKRSLVVIWDTSYPEFDKLLSAIPQEHIERVEISARTDVNPNVHATLECAITLASGVLRVRPEWCARSVNRADEIVNTLLIPLVGHKAMHKVFVVDDFGVMERLPGSYAGIIEQVFKLAGYPEAANNDAFNLSRYASQMVAAGNRA
ncbi:hypothetical protein [Pseudomonas sp.]|uniref:hypothetical protein n=1 Tax=Pseudomonas sp. TaxID=306 RepID=UPI0029061056|nr:hypothetical protein [Pseudomonas sp.]MDU4254545.1 hypothetical protein [Pseudomonas sp.]